MFEDKIKLLAKAIWGRTDIEKYFDVSPTTAIKMRDKVILDGGLVSGTENKVFSNAVIKYFAGVSRAEEMTILKEGALALEKSNKW